MNCPQALDFVDISLRFDPELVKVGNPTPDFRGWLDIDDLLVNFVYGQCKTASSSWSIYVRILEFACRSYSFHQLYYTWLITNLPHTESHFESFYWIGHSWNDPWLGTCFFHQTYPIKGCLFLMTCFLEPLRFLQVQMFDMCQVSQKVKMNVGLAFGLEQRGE